MIPTVSPDLNILDESLDENRALSCKLAVQISSVHLACTVLDLQESRYLAAQIYRFPEQATAGDFCHQLREIAASGILSWHFTSASLFVSNQLYTLVPLPLFNPSKQEDYLRFNLSGLQADVIYLTDRLPGLDAVNVFAVHRWLKDELSAIFGTTRLHHAISPFVESILGRFKYAGSEPAVFLNIQPDVIEMLILDNHKVSLCNTFKYVTPEDLLYYTMFVLEQSGLTPDQVPLMITGEVGKHAPVIENLTAFFPHIDFVTRNDAFRYAPSFEEIPGHYLHNLLNAEHCEL